MNYNFKGKWVVENVKPYYTPLMPPTIELQRHLFWSNFTIPQKNFISTNIRSGQIPELSLLHGFDLSRYKIKNKRLLLRNCVLPELGNYIFEQARKKEDYFNIKRVVPY